MRPLCIYHANCPDGFAAAWAVRKALGADNVDFQEGVYQKGPPDVSGRDVILVDFSYKRDVILEMAKTARSILILDHHKSAIEDLASVVRRVDDAAGGYAPERLLAQRGEIGLPVFAVFDLDRCGASITWDYFHPGTPRPDLMNHVEDSDLNILRLYGTREIMACVLSHGWDFEIWDDLMQHPTSSLRNDGTVLLRKHRQDTENIVRMCRRHMLIGGRLVPVANAPRHLVHDVAMEMSPGYPFAAAYYDGSDGRVFSLRTVDDTFDVSAIAAQYGGGGHRPAAGFTVVHGWEGEDIADE